MHRPLALAVLAAAAAYSSALPALAQGTPPSAAAAETPAPPTGVAKLEAEARALAPLVKSDLARRFLGATASLPAIEPRAIYRTPANTWLSAAEAEKLPEEDRAKLRELAVDTERYYATKYGSPLAYVRALDLAATCDASPPLTSLAGARVLDYGYGAVGHLRLMASLGAHCTGVDVDSFLTAIYDQPTDVGTVPGAGGAPAGSVRLVHGRFPADREARDGVAAGAAAGPGEPGYDLILSKNTLKNGYINPERPVDPRMLVDLGTDHEGFLRAMFEALRPGGLLVIHNLSPAQAPEDKPYRPWADGRSPFSREAYEKAGFRVVAFDVNDDVPVRDLARALGWDKSGMDLEADLFGHYTIVQRPKP